MINPTEGPYWDLQSQISRLRCAAEFITISERLLRDWIAFDPFEYELLKSRIEDADRQGGQNHYGLYILCPQGIEEKTLLRDRAEPLTVFGHMATFGEAQPRDRHPYLVAAVVASPDPRRPAGLVRAYIHPCHHQYRWTLVDSNLEKDTLKQLLKVRFQLQQLHGVDMYISKPLFDMGPDIETPREVCIPDFVLMPDDPQYHKNCVIVEAMGGRDEGYGDRKEVMHDMFRKIGQLPGVSDTAVEEYEPPADRTIDQYLKNFRRRVRGQILSLHNIKT